MQFPFQDEVNNDNGELIQNEPESIEERKPANVRERRRMCGINVAFLELRHCIPTFPYEKRLSKIDTLNLAIAYIKLLEEILAIDTMNSGASIHDVIQRNVNAVRNGDTLETSVWGTSDLLARLSWIEWQSRLGILPII